MSDEGPLWEMEESVEVQATPAFAFRYLTSIENTAADPGIERVETDGAYRDRPGLRGTNYLAGGGRVEWLVAAAEPAHGLVIDVALSGATLRFTFRFKEGAGGGCLVSQRVSLFGPAAAAYREEVEQGFGTSCATACARSGTAWTRPLGTMGP